MRRALLLVAAVVFLVCGVPQAAAALPIPNPFDKDCVFYQSKEAPDPEIPGTGWTAFAVRAPDKAPPPGDPFAENPTTTVFEQSGLAGFRLATYDLGCTPDVSTTGWTSFLNLLLMFPLLGISIFYGIAQMVFAPTTWLAGALDPLMTSVVDGLKAALWSPATPVGLIAVGLLGLAIIKWGWGDVAISKAAQVTAFALAACVGLAIVFNASVWLAHSLDRVLSYAVGTAATATSGVERAPSTDVAMTAAVVDTVLWPRWVSEHFGDVNSTTAKQFAGPLFETRRLSWAEAETYRKDPKGAGARIWEQKKADFERIVGQICDRDKAACSYVKGKNVGDRFGDVVITGFAALMMLPFPTMCLILVLVSYMIIRLAIMAFPVAALFLHPNTQSIVLAPAKLTLTAMVNTAVFSLACFVVLRAGGAFLAPSIATTGLGAVLLAGVLSIAAWIMLKPVRRLTHPLTGYNPRRELTKAKETVTHTISTGATTASGAAVSAVSGPWAAAAAIGGHQWAKRHTVGPDDEEPEDTTPAPYVRPVPPPPPAAEDEPEYTPPPPVPAHPQLDPHQPIAAPTAGPAKPAPSYVDDDGQEVWMLYDHATGTYKRDEVAA